MTLTTNTKFFTGSTAVVAPTPDFHWKLNEVSGTTVDDARNGHDGTASADISNMDVAGLLNGAFDMADTYNVDFGVSTDWDIGSGDVLHIFAWIKPPSDGFYDMIVGTAPMADNGYRMMCFGVLSFDGFASDGYTGVVSGSTNIAHDSWSLAELLLKNVAGTTTYTGYLNLTQEFTGTCGTFSPSSSSHPLSIGGDSPYIGLIDDVRIYKSEVNLAGRQAIYNAGAGTESPD